MDGVGVLGCICAREAAAEEAEGRGAEGVML